MATTYSGDDSTGLIVAAMLPDDGDVRAVVSVDVPFQAIFDTIASLHSGTVEFVGVHNYTSGSTIGVQSSNVILSGTSVLQIGNGCGFALANGSFLAAVNSDWAMDAASTFTIAGAFTFQAAGTLDFLSGAQVNFHGGSDLHANSGAGIHIDVGGHLQIDGDGNVNSGGEFHVNNGGFLSVENGGIARVLTGGQLNVLGTGVVHFGGTFPAIAMLQMNADSQLQLNTASMTVDSGSIIAYTNAHIQGRYVREAADVASGPNAWRGDRIHLITATSQTLDAWKYDLVGFSTGISGPLTVTLADVPSGDSHPFRFWIRGGGSGTGGNAVTFKDSMGVTVTIISLSSGDLINADFTYDPSGSPRWIWNGGTVL